MPRYAYPTDSTPSMVMAAVGGTQSTAKSFGPAAPAFGLIGSSTPLTSFASVATASTFGFGAGTIDAPVDVEPIAATPFAADVVIPSPKVKTEEPSNVAANAADDQPPRRHSGRRNGLAGGSAHVAPQSASRRSARIKVKQESTRNQPSRNGKLHKVGFYSEANLAKLAIRGSGSVKDPFVVY